MSHGLTLPSRLSTFRSALPGATVLRGVTAAHAPSRVESDDEVYRVPSQLL